MSTLAEAQQDYDKAAEALEAARQNLEAQQAEAADDDDESPADAYKKARGLRHR